MAEDQEKLAKELAQVAALVKLANDNPKSEESRTAAIKLAQKIKENRLVMIPESEIERVKTMVGEAKELTERHSQSKMQDMFFGGIIGAMLSKQLKIF
ncbi:MAG TPA: hypothetical protein DEP35_06005 [Deltaproteobacteria bacterium]|jgi:hypothetical protein|nr:hypothetical protein [Deltaproteobacteria bacterium]